MSSHRTNSSLWPLATFFSAPSGFEERKTAMISVGSTGSGLTFHCRSILSFAGTRHQAQTSNENIAKDARFMGFSISNHRQRGGTKAYSEADFKSGRVLQGRSRLPAAQDGGGSRSRNFVKVTSADRVGAPR